MKTVLALAFALAVLPGSAAGFPDARVTEAITKQMRSAGALGLAVAVVERGRVVYERGFGLRSQHGPPVDVNTRFEIGSDTKQFTAAAILQLKERGKLSLDDRLSRYVPAFPHANVLTIRELLYQTTGLPDYTFTNHFVHIMQTVPGGLEPIERLSSGPLHFAPGSKWEYSNANYIALGRVIEVVSGEPYDAYVRRHLFLAAGMRQSTTISHETQIADMAAGYWRGMHDDGPLTPAPRISQAWTWSAGDIVSTVGDLVKWDLALESGKIISARDFELMTAPATLSGGKHDDYGFGWWIDPVHGHLDVYHDGDTYAMSSSNNLYLHDGIEIIVLENQARDSAADTAAKIFEAILR